MTVADALRALRDCGVIRASSEKGSAYRALATILWAKARQVGPREGRNDDRL